MFISSQTAFSQGDDAALKPETDLLFVLSEHLNRKFIQTAYVEHLLIGMELCQLACSVPSPHCPSSWRMRAWSTSTRWLR